MHTLHIIYIYIYIYIYFFYELSYKFAFLLTGSTRLSTGVDAPPRYYHMASLNYGSMKTRDVVQIANVIREISFFMSISPMSIER